MADTDTTTTTTNTPAPNQETDDFIEPLMIPDKNRFTISNENGKISRPDIWEFYVQHQKMFWLAGKFKFYKDLPQWNTALNDQERYYIRHILSYFAASDTIVNMNLEENFINEVAWIEAKVYYTWQAAMEVIHSETYDMMLKTYVTDPIERRMAYNAITDMPSIRKKADWAFKWINRERPFAERLVAFAAVEGIFFSGSFCGIYWLKERTLMPQLTASNEEISRDEGIHTFVATYLYRKYIVRKPTQERIFEILKEACDIEKEFNTEGCPVRLIGMNSELMCQYIEHITNFLAGLLGYTDKPYPGVTSPFPFMDKIGLFSIDNFFDKESTIYTKSDVADHDEKANAPLDDYSIDEDF